MSDRSSRSLFLVVFVTALVALTACSGLSEARSKASDMVTPYKIDVVQGNVVTREQLAVLKPGMPRAMVRDILGTALLSSVFHSDRWDYVFTLKRQRAEPQSRKVTVYFKNDVLERIEADDLPSEKEFVSTLRTPVFTGEKPALEATEQNLSKFPPAAQPASAPQPVGTAPTVYPPLETPNR